MSGPGVRRRVVTQSAKWSPCTLLLLENVGHCVCPPAAPSLTCTSLTRIQPRVLASAAVHGEERRQTFMFSL